MNSAGTQPGPWRTIVGVVSNVRMLGPFNNPGVDDSGFYVPFYSTAFGPAPPTPFVSQFATVVVKPRAGQRAGALANALRREVNKADPNLPLYFVGHAEAADRGLRRAEPDHRRHVLDLRRGRHRARVGRHLRRHVVLGEPADGRSSACGWRSARTTARFSAWCCARASCRSATGLTLGFGLALAIATIAANGIQSTLFGVGARDPLTYASVAFLVTLVSLAATLVPARRATRVDPMIALRAE